MPTIIHLHIHTRAANRPDPPAPDDALQLRPCSPGAARALLRGFGAFAHLPVAEQRALWRHSATMLRTAHHPAPMARLHGGDAA